MITRQYRRLRTVVAVATVAAVVTAAATFGFSSAAPRAGAAAPCTSPGDGLYDQTAERHRTPLPDAAGHVYPIVTIHGITGTDAAFTGTVNLSYGEANPQPPRSLMDLLAGPNTQGQTLPPGLPSVHVYSYSYTPNSLRWVDDPAVGEKFGTAIDYLYCKYGVPVSVVAHSMGGLVTRWVANSNDPSGAARAPKLGKVITFGTPYLGSLLSEVGSVGEDAAAGIPGVGPAVHLLAYLCGAVSTNSGNGGPCGVFGSLNSQAGQALRLGSAQIKALVRWPAGPSVADLAGSIKVPMSLMGSPFNTSVDLGDIAGQTESATADPGPARVVECRYDTPQTTAWTAYKHIWGLASPDERHAQLTNLFTGAPCFHGHLMRNVELTNEMLGQLSDWLASQTVTPCPSAALIEAATHARYTPDDGKVLKSECAQDWGVVHVSGINTYQDVVATHATNGNWSALQVYPVPAGYPNDPIYDPAALVRAGIPQPLAQRLFGQLGVVQYRVAACSPDVLASAGFAPGAIITDVHGIQVVIAEALASVCYQDWADVSWSNPDVSKYGVSLLHGVNGQWTIVKTADFLDPDSIAAVVGDATLGRVLWLGD